MSQMQPVRGTHDLFGSDILRYRHILNAAASLSRSYGFEEIKTPIFEFTNVFSRTLGDASDIVSKEMYTFSDKGGEILSLRPEGTASIVRSFISEGLAQHLPLKFFYEGPMFRYERPQKGRYRQFYQIGVELLGVDSTDADIEVISMAEHLFRKLGVSRKVTLEINSIGDHESRNNYKQALVEYYKKHLENLSDDSKVRLMTNPLRILDSKDKRDIAINHDAPKLADYLNEASKQKFEQIKKTLADLGILFKVNPFLVRGLDYYCHLVFEYRTTALGSQDAVLSGGRYDGLTEIMGGPKAPAVGWAAGVERLSLLLDADPKKLRPISLIPLGEAAEMACRNLAHDLRGKGFFIDMSYSGNMSNRMKKATKQNAIAALIIGESELQNKLYTLKLMDTGVQMTIKETELSERLTTIYGDSSTKS
ncbi:MAG: histidine--tRNA ligase [Bdellovibrionales bacterium]|nr:histidine--tRNA ligase [Bdellovibrionales bacterium]